MLLWLHHLLLCTSVAVPQKIAVIEKAELSAGKHSRKEARRGIVGEFIKHSTGLKNNTKSTDLYGNKPSREKKSYV